MSGKIFAESANLYQDQARILFDYYREAAERIVSEEERIEKDIAVASEYKTQLNTEIAKVNLQKNIAFIAGGVLLVGFIAFLIAGKDYSMFSIVSIIGALGAGGFGVKQLLSQNNFIKELSATEIKIEEFQKLHQEIFRDYKVSKLGVGYVPVAGQIAFEDKSFLIDYTGTKNNESFVLQTLRQSDLFTDKITELEALLKEVPMVENSNETEVVDTDQYSTSIQQVTYHDYFGALDRNLRGAAYCMNDLDVTSVSLPVILPESDYAKYLNEHATSNPGRAPQFKPFDTVKYEDDIDRFHALNEMKKSLERHSVQFEDVLKNLMVNMANSVQAITKLKVSSTNRIIDQSNSLLYKILKVSYNHYSPALEAEEIERIRMESFDFSESVEKYEPFQLKQSSRVKYDLISERWVAEDGSNTSFPFGMHQIHEEIVAPMVQNLMQETRLERFKIYNNIKDQKINYLNKWHQDTEDFYGRNRAESNDLINIMRSTLSEYIAAFNTLTALENTEKSMKETSSLDSTVVESKDNSAEVFASFNIKSQEFQQIQTDFADYMERLKNDIDLKASKFEHIEYYDASLRDSSPKSMAVATGRMQDLDPRRKQLIAVNPFYAETSELPPAPNIEDITHEHMSINLSAVAKSALNDLNDGVDIPMQDIGADFVFKKVEKQEPAIINTEAEAEISAADEPIAEPVADVMPEPAVDEVVSPVVNIIPDTEEVVIPVIEEITEAPVVEAITPVHEEPISPIVEETVSPATEETIVSSFEEPIIPGEEETKSHDFGEAIIPEREETTVPDFGETIIPGRKETTAPDFGETIIPEKEGNTAPDFGETIVPGREETPSPIVEETTTPIEGPIAPVDAPVTPPAAQAPIAAINCEAIAETYTARFAAEFTDQVVFVSPVSVNVFTSYDGIQIACENKTELESTPTFWELFNMDKSNTKQLLWQELKDDDGGVMYTIQILLIEADA